MKEELKKKMNDIKISVIAPSLNVVNYIDECIQSVIGQTLTDLEIICVDAGSTDGTFEKLVNYSNEDKRIKVVKSDKKSYGYQVNLGFSMAQGEYLAIVETDDYVKKDMYENLYIIAKSNDLDYVKADFAQFNGCGEQRVFTHRNIVESPEYYNKVIWAGDEWSVFNGSIYPWAGIYKRSLIVDNNIKLNETPGASYQDNGLCFQVYAYGKRGFFVKEEYYYLRREEQDASYYAPHKYKEILDEFDFIYDFLVGNDFYDVFGPRFCKLKFQTFCWRANMLADEHKLEFMRLFAESFKKAQAEGTLDLRCFNSDEKKRLFNIMACPELECWKRYYTLDSTWQKEFGNNEKHVISINRKSVANIKILIIIHELTQSGAPLSTLAQCKILQQSGANVTVWSLKDGVLADKYREIEIPVRIVYPNEFERSWVKDEIRTFDLAIICTVLSVPAAAVCESLIPTIFYIRSDGQLLDHFFRKAIVFQKEYKNFYSILNAKYMVAVSDYCGEWVSKNLNPNVFIINNFIEDIAKSYSPNMDKNKIRFLALGSIEYRKGFDIYLDAFLSLPKGIRDCCELHFAGRELVGQEEYYKKIVQLSDKYDNCIFHGEILDRDKIYQLISDCDVIVVPSRSESCSRVALEGAMLSKPLIVTEDVGAKYLVDEYTGWIVKTGDIESLATAFNEAIVKKENLVTMGKEIRKKYLKTSTPQIYANNFISYVERVLSDWDEQSKKNDDVKLYSFDVFDTLITRTTATPFGIFALMQQKIHDDEKWSEILPYTRNNFYELRVNAERLARAMKNGTDFEKRTKSDFVYEDITLDEIYHVFTFSNLLSEEQAIHLKNLEIETEIEAVIGIPRNIDIVKQLIYEGKRVVAVSDMYHSSETIKRMLMAADPIFENIDIYVSSEYSMTKSTGNLYRSVGKLEGIGFEQWYHTGDNKKVDYEVAKNFGITAELYPISWRSRFEDYILHEKINDIFVQQQVAFAKNARIKYNLRKTQAIGADLATFLLIPYVEFIIDNCIARNIKRLYFISRDGYVLKEIADIIIKEKKMNILTKYIFASRKAWRVFPQSIEDIDLVTLISYSNFNFIKTYDDLADAFMITKDELCSFIDIDEDTNKINYTELYSIVKDLNQDVDFKKFIIKKNNKKRELFEGYISQEVDMSDENYAFVELDGSGYTNYMMSKGMYDKQKVQEPIKTFYYWATGVNFASMELEFISFFPSKISTGNIIECLCRAPHPQVIEYEKIGNIYKPVFEDTNEEELLLSAGFQDYMYGVLCAAKTYQYGIVSNTLRVVEKAFEYITKRPDEEMLAFLGDIPFSITGRGGKISTFAPALTRTDIFNVYFLRHISNEPIENYFEASYFDYCLLRLSEEDKKLIRCYEMKVNELRRQNMLQKLTHQEINEIRYQMEVRCYGNCEISYVSVRPQNSYTDKDKKTNIVCIEQAEYENLKYNSYCLEEVRKSFSYKVGLIFTKPFRMLKAKREVKNSRKEI